jgi:hypothetical protein
MRAAKQYDFYCCGKKFSLLPKLKPKGVNLSFGVRSEAVGGGTGAG